MTDQMGSTLNHWKKLLLATVGAAAIVGPIVVGLLNAPRLRAQSASVELPEKLRLQRAIESLQRRAQSTRDLRVQGQSATVDTGRPTFEVASVKPNKSGDNRVAMMAQPGGRVTATNVTLRMLMRNAFRVQDFQIVEGPSWINADRFDIVAKAEGNPSQDQVQLMMRALLADRFKLAVHTEARELPVYALVLARSDGKPGRQLRQAEPCVRPPGSAPPQPPASGQAPPCNSFRIGPGRITANGVDLATLVASLSNFVGRIVLDRTGLSGAFDLDLEWTPDQMPSSPPGGAPPDAPPPPPADGPSIFTAVQEQLGLKLESQRGPVDVLVIDRVEKPTED